MPGYGDLMPLDCWLASRDCEAFIPYDGDGYWATTDGMDRDSSVWNSNCPPPEWATHVAWFNR